MYIYIYMCVCVRIIYIYIYIYHDNYDISYLLTCYISHPSNARPPVELAFTELRAFPTGPPLCLPLDSSGFGA